MDSPFLTNKPLDDDDGTLVLADLSIADEDSFDLPPSGRAFGRQPPPAAASGSVSASSSIASSSRLNSAPPPSTARPSKPRFSLFAPGMAEVTPAHSSTLRPSAAVRPPLEPPSARSERNESSSSKPPERPSRERRPPTFGWDETLQEEPEREDVGGRTEDAAPERREEPQTAEARDEALRTSLAELRRINTVFDTLMGALEEGRAHNTVSSSS